MAEPNPAGSYLVRFAGEHLDVDAGHVVFAAGEPATAMYVVRAGEVEVRVDDRVVETVGPGGIVGEMALIDGGLRSASVVAKTACQLVPIDEARFKFLVQQTPFFAIEVMRQLARRLRGMNVHEKP